MQYAERAAAVKAQYSQ